MERILNRNRKILKCTRRGVSKTMAEISRIQIKVSSLINRLWLSPAHKIKILKLRANVCDIAKIFCLDKSISQYKAWIACKSLTSRSLNIAEYVCNYTVICLPWKNLECVCIRECEKIGLLLGSKAVNVGAVKTNALNKSLF